MEAIVAVAFWLIGCPILCAIIAGHKGLGSGRWMVGGFFFGIFALILLIVLPANAANVAQEEVKSGLRKICPFCAETVLAAAKVCRYCGKDIQVVKEVQAKSEIQSHPSSG